MNPDHIIVTDRPYILRFKQARGMFQLSSEDVRNLIYRDGITVEKVTGNAITFSGGDRRGEVIPATMGGGPAFIIEKS